MTDFFLATADDTDRLGAQLAATRPPQAVMQLRGDLGAGKSTLARALLRALGVQGAIRSPTYTLVERYPLSDGSEAWHLDLYRIGQADELEFLGLDEGSASLWLVEWPERGAGALPPTDLVVALEIDGQGRRASLTSVSDAGAEWVQRLREGGDLRPLSVG